jgi:hypothetical protein
MTNSSQKAFRLVKTGKQLVCEAKQKFSTGAVTLPQIITHQFLGVDLWPQDTDRLFIFSGAVALVPGA